jgi:hypothetical protein
MPAIQPGLQPRDICRLIRRKVAEFVSMPLSMLHRVSGQRNTRGPISAPNIKGIGSRRAAGFAIALAIKPGKRCGIMFGR